MGDALRKVVQEYATETPPAAFKVEGVVGWPAIEDPDRVRRAMLADALREIDERLERIERKLRLLRDEVQAQNYQY